MKTFGISIHGWYMSMFMLLTGKDQFNLPEDTCSLFWQSARMLVLFPVIILGALAMKVTGEINKESGDGGLWSRIFSTFLVLFGYFIFLMIGDSVIGAAFFDLGEKEYAMSHLGGFAYVWLPIVGAFVIGIPLVVVFGLGVGVYHSFKYIKEEYQEVAEEKFSIKIDEETNLPINKFWAIMYMIHDKTCAKIKWEN